MPNVPVLVAYVSQPEDNAVLLLVEKCMRFSFQTQKKAEASARATNLVVLFKECAGQTTGVALAGTPFRLQVLFGQEV